MARFTGYKCDVCDKAADASDKGGLPPGFLQVVLPDTPDNPRPEDRSRDICSGRCLVEFGRQRGEADGSMRPKAAKPKVTMDPGLRAYLEAEGITGKGLGQVLGSHTRFHQDEPSPTCKVCEYDSLGVAGVGGAA